VEDSAIKEFGQGNEERDSGCNRRMRPRVLGCCTNVLNGWRKTCLGMTAGVKRRVEKKAYLEGGGKRWGGNRNGRESKTSEYHPVAGSKAKPGFRLHWLVLDIKGLSRDLKNREERK